MSLETASANDVASEVCARIDLQKFLAEYNYKPQLDDSPTFVNESRRLQSQGYLTGHDLHKLARWKSPRSAKWVLENADDYVQEVTRVAFRLAQNPETSPSLPVAVLTALIGVRVPIASAVLTVWDPLRFGIIDVNAWSAMFNYKKRRTHAFEPRDYDHYSSILNCIHESSKLTPREIDMALWTWWDKKHGLRRKRANR